jgi:histidine triad (HIT) family protein
MASVFTKIIRGELPSFKIFENEEVFAFLSIDPIRPGHTLIVPKVEIDQFTDLAEPHYSAVFAAAQPLGRAIRAATGCRRVGMAVQGFEVPHFHLHLIPLESPADFDFQNARRASMEDLAATQQRILAKIKD